MNLLERINKDVLTPALAMLPARLDSPEARVMLLAIGSQESRLTARVQLVGPLKTPTGPARGLWQFERAGGVQGVLSHTASKHYAQTVCELRAVAPTARAVWSRLAEDDLLAAAFARLLLLTDPRPLPELGRGHEAWAYYLDNWRPGKPHPSTWNGLYAKALAAVTE